MKYLKSFSVNENKMWYKNIPELLEWIDSISNRPFIFIDTETTGLKGPKHEQLTQISAIVYSYNFSENKFSEVDKFDDKIKLTSDIKSKYNNPNEIIKKVLSFNHYGSGNYKYKEELSVLSDFFEFLSKYESAILVIQNASFDLKMLSYRSKMKIKNKVLDTKILLQLYFLPLIQKLSETSNEYKDMVKYIGTSQRDNGLISSSMSKIGPALGINMAGYHDSLTDCRITMNMFVKVIDILNNNKQVNIFKYQKERINTYLK